MQLKALHCTCCAERDPCKACHVNMCQRGTVFVTIADRHWGSSPCTHLQCTVRIVTAAWDHVGTTLKCPSPPTQRKASRATLPADRSVCTVTVPVHLHSFDSLQLQLYSIPVRVYTYCAGHVHVRVDPHSAQPPLHARLCTYMALLLFQTTDRHKTTNLAPRTMLRLQRSRASARRPAYSTV